MYALGDELSVVADGLEVAVRNERQPGMIGARKGPLFMMRPRADYAANHCYEGFYNPYEIAHPDSAGLSQSFVLCKDPENPDDATAFFIGLRARTSKYDSLDEQRKVQEIAFTARTLPGLVEVKIAGDNPRTVALPVDSAPFGEHPEYVGAMVALGVWPVSARLTR
ncbi:MAG TPA: hypothetical protein VGH20_06650 [Myxococcales bacterium]